MPSAGTHDVIRDAVVICGFNSLGSFIASYLQQTVDPSSQASQQQQQQSQSQSQSQGELDGLYLNALEYVAFDLDPRKVMEGYRKGYRVLYGDACQVGL